MTLKVLVDKDDGTINHVYPDSSEFRLAFKPEKQTCYLSSHTGCSLGCQMCHLTTTGQTLMAPLTHQELMERAEALLDKVEPGKRLKFSFMARGDALANPAVNGRLVRELTTLAHTMGRHGLVELSTIFPRNSVGEDIEKFLLTRFGSFTPVIYWSLYSLKPAFREKWLPQAQDPKVVIPGLVKWQEMTKQQVYIHHALIAGENDEDETCEDICDFLDFWGLDYRLNLVHYNPPDDSSKEADEAVYARHLERYQLETRGAKVNPRIGTMVHASCGCFDS